MTKKMTKAKVLKMTNEERIQELSALFDIFAIKLNNGVPKKVLKELNDLMEDHNSEEDISPIMAIRKAIDEWLDGGRI
jgi:hypothetical protein